MKHFLFQVKSEFSLENALKELKKLGIQDHYIVEDVATEDTWIGGMIDPSLLENEFISVSLKGPNDVNWFSQWESFSENFQNGMAHIDLSPFGKQTTLYLLPGEGFGDLSHPTTYLMMELMQDRMLNESVIDIGAGSGILSCFAKIMGAKQVLSIEHHLPSLYHSQKNALKNHLEISFNTELDLSTLSKHNLFVMNMTFQEQVDFMQSCLKVNQYAKNWIISGILSEQKKRYLEKTKSWGWHLEKLKEKEKWLGMIFSVKQE